MSKTPINKPHQMAWERYSAIRSKKKYELKDASGYSYFPASRQRLSTHEEIVNLGSQAVEFVKRIAFLRLMDVQS